MMPDDNFTPETRITPRARLAAMYGLPFNVSDAALDRASENAAARILEAVSSGRSEPASFGPLLGVAVAIATGLALANAAQKLGPSSAKAVTWPVMALSARTPDDLRKLQEDVAKTADALSEHVKGEVASPLRETVAALATQRDSLAALTSLLPA